MSHGKRQSKNSWIDTNFCENSIFFRYESLLVKHNTSENIKGLGHMSSISAPTSTPIQLLKEDIQRLILHYGENRIAECGGVYSTRSSLMVVLGGGYTIKFEVSEWPGSHRHLDVFAIEVLSHGIVQGSTNLKNGVFQEKNQLLVWEQIEEFFDLVYEGKLRPSPLKAFRESLPPLVQRPGEDPILIEDEGHVHELIRGLVRPPEVELKFAVPYSKFRDGEANSSSDWTRLQESANTSKVAENIRLERIKNPSLVNFQKIKHDLSWSGIGCVYRLSDSDIVGQVTSNFLTIVIITPMVGDNYIVGIGEMLCEGKFAPQYFFSTQNDPRHTSSSFKEEQSEEDLHGLLGTLRQTDIGIYNRIFGILQKAVCENTEEAFVMLLPQLKARLVRYPDVSQRFLQIVEGYGGIEEFVKDWEQFLTPAAPAPAPIPIVDSSRLRSQGGDELEQILDLLKPQDDPRS